jgi:aryl-alcohol dehydrogenase
MTSARAFVIFEQSSPLKEVQVQLDDLRPNELLVEIKATSICATDINVQTGKIPVPLPAVVGHEGECTYLRTASSLIAS